MRKYKEIDYELIKSKLHYDKLCGVFKWKVKQGQAISIGDTAGSLHHTGYTTFRLNRREYSCHRAAWAVCNSIRDFGEIDHINGIRSDNRIDNLRLVSRSGNQQNKAINSNNTTGHTGVCRVRNGRWRSIITIDGVRHSKFFGSFDDACDWYKVQKNNLHLTHGSYVNRYNVYKGEKL